MSTNPYDYIYANPKTSKASTYDYDYYQNESLPYDEQE